MTFPRAQVQPGVQGYPGPQAGPPPQRRNPATTILAAFFGLLTSLEAFGIPIHTLIEAGDVLGSAPAGTIVSLALFGFAGLLLLIGTVCCCFRSIVAAVLLLFGTLIALATVIAEGPLNGVGVDEFFEALFGHPTVSTWLHCVVAGAGVLTLIFAALPWTFRFLRRGKANAATLYGMPPAGAAGFPAAQGMPGGPVAPWSQQAGSKQSAVARWRNRPIRARFGPRAGTAENDKLARIHSIVVIVLAGFGSLMCLLLLLDGLRSSEILPVIIVTVPLVTMLLGELLFGPSGQRPADLIVLPSAAIVMIVSLLFGEEGVVFLLVYGLVAVTKLLGFMPETAGLVGRANRYATTGAGAPNPAFPPQPGAANPAFPPQPGQVSQQQSPFPPQPGAGQPPFSR